MQLYSKAGITVGSLTWSWMWYWLSLWIRLLLLSSNNVGAEEVKFTQCWQHSVWQLYTWIASEYQTTLLSFLLKCACHTAHVYISSQIIYMNSVNLLLLPESHWFPMYHFYDCFPGLKSWLDIGSAFLIAYCFLLVGFTVSNWVGTFCLTLDCVIQNAKSQATLKPKSKKKREGDELQLHHFADIVLSHFIHRM